ncbi:hypothetical protein GIB67_023357 [Kingdonia uniflora]|uniref:Uncharacterized protein n=1 Tax=Kingdonia uniflora TaxID=39325 RepID=A0A7J7LIE0_9MAGN|nr:hypothetical protein GIB67_023357 [Kingdonia uniflora]
MGTKIECVVDHLASLQRNYSIDAIKSSDYSELYTKGLLKNAKTAPYQFQKSMDRLLEKYDKESARNTIIKQEEMFKGQVRELHRVYKNQKKLMAELSNNNSKLHMLNNPSSRVREVGASCIGTDNRSRSFDVGNCSETNHLTSKNWNQLSTQNDSSCHHQLSSFRTALSLQGHGSTSSKSNLGMRKGFDLERLAEEDVSKNKIGTSNSLDPLCHADEESDVELTLSIGFGTTSKKKPKNQNQYSRQEPDSTMFIRSDRGEEYGNPTNNALLNRESLQHPPWLFQSQSLNRT